MLDHLSDGRLNFGVAASGLPSDWAMFNVDGMSGQNRDMTREALEIILKLWSEDAPFDLQGQVLDGDQAGHDVRLPQAAHQAAAGAASADRRRRPLQGLGHAEARRRARLHADEPQPQPGLCRQPLGLGRGRRRQDRAQAEPAGLAAGARGVRRRYRRGGLAAVGRRHDGPDDGRVFPAAARPFRLQGLPEARARRAGQRRHRRVLRPAQLDRRLARDRRPRRSRRSTTRSAASACCWCSASTTSTSRRPGTIRCGC